MERFNRFFCYTLLLSIPLCVLITPINAENIVQNYFEGKYFLNMRLMVMPPKYFLWGILLSLMLILTLFQRVSFQWKISHFFLFIFWGWILSSFIWSINRYETLESFTQWSLILAFIFL